MFELADRERLRQMTEERRHGRALPGVLELRVQRKDGTSRHVRNLFVPIDCDGERLKGVGGGEGEEGRGGGAGDGSRKEWEVAVRGRRERVCGGRGGGCGGERGGGKEGWSDGRGRVTVEILVFVLWLGVVIWGGVGWSWGGGWKMVVVVVAWTGKGLAFDW